MSTSGHDIGDLDTEHANLHQILNMLKSVIATGSTAAATIQAITIARQRLQFHFDREETVAAKHAPPEDFQRLVAEHNRFVALLDRMKEAAESGADERKKALLDDFLSELDRHDREIDTPIFRAIASRSKDL